MKKIVLWILFILTINTVYAWWMIEAPTSSDSSSTSSNTSTANSNSDDNNWWWNTSDCIKLNTNFPWVWKCISPTDPSSAFSWLMWWLMKLVVNITIAVSFIALIASGIMLTTSWISQSTAWKWKELLKKVVLWIALLWLSWLILHTINPNFYKTEMSIHLLKKINP